MDQQIRKKRGPSSASKEAGEYFAMHPETSAMELAARFRVAEPTIYRAEWWIAAKGEKKSKAPA